MYEAILICNCGDQMIGYGRYVGCWSSLGQPSVWLQAVDLCFTVLPNPTLPGLFL